jgi:PAS domain S-box-containing protein
MTLAIALIAQNGMSLLSGIRAYVGGEGLWSKAQKDAVNALHRYAETRDEGAFREYETAIAVPLGDRVARQELDRPRPDLEAVRRGFVQGRNHPDDVREMARLYRDFRRVPAMRRAIEIWQSGDREIDALIAAAGRLREAVRSGAPRPQLAPILEEIDAVNARATPLEDDFSFTLGEAARWARQLLWGVLAGTAALLFTMGALAVRRLVLRIEASEARYRDIADSATDGILSVDADGRVLLANPAAARLFAFGPAPLGSVASELFPDGEIAEALRGAHGGAGPDSVTAAARRVRARRRDGTEFHAEVSFGEGARPSARF